ncbi:MAG: hypothetical protein WBA45_12745 [Microthrixaceae bacterium]
MLKKRPARTWLEVAVATAGLRTGVRALTWAHEWAVARASLGHDPTVEEVAEWWGLTRRTAFREQAAFREAFPTLESPAAMYATEEAQAGLKALADFGDKIDEIGEKRRARKAELGVAQLGSLPANL